MADVFISYARQSKDVTRRLSEALEARGYSVWWDPGLLPADQFIAKFNSELRESRAVIVVWTDAAALSSWVISEAQFGREQNKLVSVRARGFLQSPPVPFNSIHHVLSTDLASIEAALLQLGVEPSRKVKSTDEPFDPELLLGRSETLAASTACLRLARELLQTRNWKASRVCLNHGLERLSGLEESLPKLMAFLSWGSAIVALANGEERTLIDQMMLDASTRCPLIVPRKLPDEVQLALDDFEYALKKWHAESARARSPTAEIPSINAITREISRISWAEVMDRQDALDGYLFQTDMFREK